MDTTPLTPSPHRSTRNTRSTRAWLVRSDCGATAERCSLIDVAQLILDGHLSSEGEISTGDGRWTRMSDVFEPEGLGVALRALGHVPLRS